MIHDPGDGRVDSSTGDGSAPVDDDDDGDDLSRSAFL
jgi:hypothetical protein